MESRVRVRVRPAKPTFVGTWLSLYIQDGMWGMQAAIFSIDGVEQGPENRDFLSCVRTDFSSDGLYLC